MEACNCCASVGKPPGAPLFTPVTVPGFLLRWKATFAGDVCFAARSARGGPVVSAVPRTGTGGATAAGDARAVRAERAGVAPADVVANQVGESWGSVLDELRREAEEVLEWRTVCSRVGGFASTSMGRDVCEGVGLPVGRDREESQELLDQTAAAVLLPRPLDFSGVEDVSRIVSSAVAGEVLSIRELCTVERSIRAARHVYEQLVDISSVEGSSNRCIVHSFFCIFIEFVMHILLTFKGVLG